MKTIPDLESAVAAAEAAVATADANVERFAGQLADIKAKLAEHVAAKESRATWEADSRALGKEPVAPPETARPAAPAVGRPSVEALADAVAVLRAADDAAAVAKERAGKRAAAAKAVETATTRHAAAEAAVLRYEALVQAVRDAPTAIVKRMVDALGDLGPVRFVFPATEKPSDPCIAAEVRDERGFWTAWDRASTGTKVIADLYLRDALGRTAGLKALPLVGDDAQSWTFARPTFTRPTWWLESRVTPGGAIVVSAGADLGAAQVGAA